MIHIKKSHRGELHRELHIPLGQKIPVKTLIKLKKTGTAKEKKQATFALNARKWNR